MMPWYEDNIQAIGSRNSDHIIAAAIPYLNGATGTGRVVLNVRVDDYSHAVDSEGIYPEFTP